jgi:hypothetical protein
MSEITKLDALSRRKIFTLLGLMVASTVLPSAALMMPEDAEAQPAQPSQPPAQQPANPPPQTGTERRQERRTARVRRRKRRRTARRKGRSERRAIRRGSDTNQQ